MAATVVPTEVAPRRLAARLVQTGVAAGVLMLIVALAPGLDEVRDVLAGASAGWLAIAVGLEALSCLSYVAMFRPVFCRRMPRRRSRQMAWSQLGMGSIVPASGAGGLALGAWLLHRDGMAVDRIARRSVAFFLIKSSVNFVAVAVLGLVMALGLWGPDLPLWLTALPAALSVAVIAAVIATPRLGPGADPAPDANRARRGASAARRAAIQGTSTALAIVRSRNLVVLGGAIGYWAFDNAVLYATFQAVGASPELSIVLLGYLIGQLGGLLPIPGGIGGIDGGLIGTLIVFGAPAAATVAAVLAYRVILFWLPLVVGGLAFASLRRDLAPPHPARPLAVRYAAGC